MISIIFKYLINQIYNIHKTYNSIVKINTCLDYDWTDLVYINRETILYNYKRVNYRYHKKIDYGLKYKLIHRFTQNYCIAVISNNYWYSCIL